MFAKRKELTRFQKVVLCSLIAMAVLFAVLTKVFNGDWRIYAACLLVSLPVAAMTAFPEELFLWNRFWYEPDPKPTKLYFTMHRIGCSLMTLALLMGAVMGLA